MAPDAIVVLSAGIKQDAHGRWVSTDLTVEDDTFGAPGGKLRVLATAILANQYPLAAVIASGGMGYDVPEGAPSERPTLAEIMRQELLDAGVAAERILLEEESNTTYQQLQQLEALANAKGIKKLLLVTNRWHLARLLALLDAKFPELKESGLFAAISAEEVLTAHDEVRWGPTIAEAYASTFLHERMLREEQGIKQIQDGTYHFK